MKTARTLVDILMLVLLILLMAYSLIGEETHEVIGISIFGIFIAHHIINRNSWAGLFKGKYNVVRILNTIVNMLLVIYMVMQPVSGILMSKYVLKEIRIAGTMGALRTIHLVMAYWGFILLSFHLGLHGRSIITSLKPRINKTARVTVTAVFMLISAYGVYAFIKRKIGCYLFMKTLFVFFDYSESRIIFLLDYLAIMILVASIGYFLQGGLIALNKMKKHIDK